jgi:hypothetical protein
MKIGSHTQEHLAKLVPQLDADYRKALEEQQAARQAYEAAEYKCRESHQQLVDATMQLIRMMPKEAVASLIDRLESEMAAGPNPEQDARSEQGQVS